MGLFAKTRILLDMIKFEHTVFALPFAYLGAFLAAKGPPDLRTSLLILLAMAGARTAAMGFNRIVDVPYDARNPRTCGRAIPTGKVRMGEAWTMVILASVAFFLAAFLLNRMAFFLSPFVLAVTLFYSYTKRFSSLCHLFLGLAIGISPTAGWIAVCGDVGLLPLVVSSGVIFWVAGFDILYSCLDLEFDRSCGLFSIPARYGLKKAFRISALFHAIAFILFAAAGFMAQLGWIYAAGLAVTLVLLVLQRRIVSPDDLSRMDMAFFTLNGAISMVLFAATAASLLVRA
ncbi:MAG: putative 4-hydroxybenzoate polyprenyltransferase [Deltaproteobacteria bacterium]